MPSHNPTMAMLAKALLPPIGLSQRTLGGLVRCSSSPLTSTRYLLYHSRFKGYPSYTSHTQTYRSTSSAEPSRHQNCRLTAGYPSSYTQTAYRLSSSTSDEPSHHQNCRLPSDFLSTLQKLHPNLAISTNFYDLDSHGHGESYHPTKPPDAVIRPTSVEEIQDILRLCCRERKVDGEDLTTVEVVSVIPYGAGTSVEGHLEFLFPTDDTDTTKEDGEIVDIPSSCFSNHDNNTVNAYYKKVRVQRKGGVSIDMCNFQSIGEVGSDSFVTVGAGVTRNTLNEALRHTGMQFMVDPGADATIGGMTACGASGTSAVKYGTMRENVMAMTAILPPPTISSVNDDNMSDTDEIASVVQLGCKALKSSAGYNLPGLLLGSEGTLGVLTDVTVKLHPIPANVVAASCAFEDLHSAAEAVAMIKMMGIPVSRIELLDVQSIKAFNQTLSSDDVTKPMEVKSTLFMEFASHSETSVLEDLSAAQSICIDEFEGSNFVSASDESTRQSLWAARHRLYYSSIALRAGSGDDDNDSATPQSTILTDVCVPLSSFAEIISATAKDVADLGVIGPCFGHAGDGNFHCILPLTKNDTKEYRDNVSKVIENLTDRAIEVGGTCTGEHGVGYGKIKYLKRMYGSGGVSMMEAIKHSIDPFNVMNPGKIVENDFYSSFKRG